MERMPYQPHLDPEPGVWPANAPVVTSDWRTGLPVLLAGGVTLREVRRSDAASLLALLSTEEVGRFIAPPPSTVEGWERFIAWSQRERVAGRHVCFAVVPDGWDTAVGLFQVRQADPSFATASWGVVLGAPFWGTGLFVAAAEAVADFAFATLGVRRLEARSVVRNGRANGALRKLGATREGVLRRSFCLRGEWVDEAIWSILAEEWCLRVPPSPPVVH